MHMRDLRNLCFILALFTGLLCGGWTYHMWEIEKLDARIAQLEEDMNDDPECPRLGEWDEAEDEMLATNETEI